MEFDQLSEGDFVLIRLQPGTDPRTFGTELRLGTVTAFGIDILEAELIVELDDDGPPIYASHIATIIPAARMAASRRVR